MIQIKFLGGAKKSFATGRMSMDESGMTVGDLLDALLKIKPGNTPDLDVSNILVAVNGADSSALQGRVTVLNDGDVVSIIPVIHGGSGYHTRLCILNRHVAAVRIRGSRSYDYALLEDLRKRFPGITLQAVDGRFVLNRRHLEKLVALSLRSGKKHILLSHKLETDLLMRFALSGQISEAIRLAGLQPGRDFVLIGIGSTRSLDALERGLDFDAAPLFAADNSAFLRRHFGITKKNLDSALSKDRLADLLAERAAVLFP